MTILQCSIRFTGGYHYLFGINHKIWGNNLKTKRQVFTYIVSDKHHTKDWYGNFKLELIK